MKRIELDYTIKISVPADMRKTGKLNRCSIIDRFTSHLRPENWTEQQKDFAALLADVFDIRIESAGVNFNDWPQEWLDEERGHDTEQSDEEIKEVIKNHNLNS